MSTPQNIILVSVDSLRADHCSFLGDERELMPSIDRMARDGVVFTTAISPGPQTYSSMPAIFTGVYRDPAIVQAQPHEHYWERRLAAISEHLARFAPIQERLRELGYSTAGVSPNPWTSRAAGFDRGFDHFLDISGTKKSRIQAVVERLPGLDLNSKPVELVLNSLTNSSFFSRWETFYDELLALRTQLEEPYFLWVFVLDTHFPYITSGSHRRDNWLPTMLYASARSRRAMLTGTESPPKHVRTLLQRSYRDTVRAVDAFVDQLWTDFQADDPVLVFHSDHGESLGERGFYGHHDRVFEENIHVPYFVYDGESTGTVDDPTPLSTIHDAIVALARDGRFDPAMAASKFAFARSELYQNRTLRGRRWKYIDSENDGPLLFDLGTDGDERRNVAPEYPELVRLLQRELDLREQHVIEQSRIAQVADTLETRAVV